MLRLIINADDFGKDHIVNVAIENQIKIGNITSTTIMANADGYEEAIRIAKAYPHISYGVHLTLDEYAPVLSQDIFEVKGIVDKQTGLFVNGKIWNVKFDEDLIKAIRNEWDAQIKKIINANVVLSHIDSHHHVHTIPELKDVLLELGNKYAINKVRGGDYMTIKKFCRGWKHFQNRPRFFDFLYLIARYPRVIKGSHWKKQVSEFFQMTDDFCSVSTFVRNDMYFKKYGEGLTVELECHPGHSKYINETALLDQVKGCKISYLEL